VEFPCRDLQYSLDNAAQDGDTIRLVQTTNDDGNLLEINKTINIVHSSLTIEALANSRLTIQAANHLNVLFNFKKNFSRIRFKRIVFSNATFFTVTNKTVDLTLHQCTFKSMQKPFVQFVGSNQTSSTSIYIDDSTIDVIGSILNHTTTSNNDELFVQIRDSRITGGTITSSSVTSPFDMIMQNVFYDIQQSDEDNIEKILINIIAMKHREARITLDKVLVQVNMSTTDFLHCNRCNLTITNISFVNTTINRGFHLERTLGSHQINQIRLESASVKSGFMYLEGSTLGINEIILELNTSIGYDSILNVTQDSNATINSVKVSDVKSKSGQLIAVWYNSNADVKSIDIRRSNFSGSEVLRTGAASQLIVHKIHMSNSHCHQAVLIAGIKHYNTSGRTILNDFEFLNNTAVSTLIGVVDAELFYIRNTKIIGNSYENTFFIERSTAQFIDLHIQDNTYEKCFELKKSDIDINGVDISYNKAKKEGKALLYENDDGKRFTINIQNFHSTIINHREYDHKGAIFSIDITDSSLTLVNVTLDVKDMLHQQVKGVHLKFKTLNTLVKPALTITCPSNYNISQNPQLLSGFFTYSIDCVSCPRGSYAINGSSEKILHIDNEGFDVEHWKNDGRTFLHHNTTKIQQCWGCPPGGNCTQGIKSLGNYYGELKGEKVEFSPCPNSYCCSNLGKPCVNYTSCNHHRRGILCGTCDYGYYESYFSSKCISDKKCTVGNQERFWVIFIATALILTIAICITKDFAIISVHILNDVRLKIAKLMQKLTRSQTKEISKEIDFSQFVYKNQVVINGCMILEQQPRRFIFSAVLQIMLSFFQIVSLISLNSGSAENQTLRRVINLFNLQIAVKEAEELCPSPRFTVIWKYFTKNVLFVVTMVLFLFFSAICSKLFKLFFTKRCCSRSSIRSPCLLELKKSSFIDRLVVGFVKILMFGYKNISLFTIVSLHCVEMNNTSVLFISGEVQCYQKWQWAVTAFFVVWVIPFPVALVMSYKLFTRGSIDALWFVICLIFPPLIIFFVIRDRRQEKHFFGNLQGLQALLYDMFEEPYRVTSQEESCTTTMYWWTAWRLYERLIIAMIVTFITQPLLRMGVVAPVIVCLLLLHYHARPYKENMTLLSWLDISSFACLTFYVVDNMFRSFSYTFDIPIENPIDIVTRLLEVCEIILTPFTILSIFIIVYTWKTIYRSFKEASK